MLLYGGGLSIGSLAFATGLADALGRGITAWLPSHTTLSLTVIFTGASIVLSEATSNTAAANMIVPVAIAVAQAAGVRPVEPALGATLGSSMGFMMPISTAPNAIVYSSGFIPITSMMRYGIALDLVAFVLIVLLVWLGAPLLFEVSPVTGAQEVRRGRPGPGAVPAQESDAAGQDDVAGPPPPDYRRLREGAGFGLGAATAASISRAAVFTAATRSASAFWAPT